MIVWCLTTGRSRPLAVFFADRPQLRPDRRIGHIQVFHEKEPHP